MTLHWSGRPRRHYRRDRVADIEIARNIGGLVRSMIYPPDALPDSLADHGILQGLTPLLSLCAAASVLFVILYCRTRR